MIQSKYDCHEDLCAYDLDVNLFERFGLYVYEVVPIRKAFILCTDKGNKILKKVSYPLEELTFIYNSLNYINKNFNRTISFVKTLEGDIYTLWNDEVYFIMDLVKGRESEFSNPIDLKITSKSLAQFHKAGEGINSYINFKNRNSCGAFIDNLKRKKEEIVFFKSISKLYEDKNEFDQMFLENVDHNIYEAQKSISILENSKYYEICNSKEKVVLCHHDLAHHNVIIKANKGYFIDFDYSIIDLKVHDLCNYITKAVKNSGYHIEKAKDILDEYVKINNIDQDEMEVLYGMLTFPEDFYSISRDYYTKRKDWSLDTFINRIDKKTCLSQERSDFLFEFEKLI